MVDVTTTSPPHGAFVRSAATFHDWVTADGSSAFPAESGRYHLYVSLACPWAHRTIIVRHLKGLEDVVSMSVVDPIRDERGWAFTGAPRTDLDQLNDFTFLAEAYIATDPAYHGRVTVPVLWDKQSKRIVNNESAEVIRMLNNAFNAFTDVDLDLYPAPLAAEIDAINNRVYDGLNNAVYRAGFGRTQAAYDAAVHDVFDTLDWLEERLDDAPLPARRPAVHRGRLAHVHHPRPLRPGVRHALPLRPPPDRRLPRAVRLPARPVRGARRGRDG